MRVRAKKFISPAGYNQVLVTVMIDISPARVDIFKTAVVDQVTDLDTGEFSGRILQEQSLLLPLGGTDKNIIQTILVYVTDGKGGSFGRQHVRDQRSLSNS